MRKNNYWPDELAEKIIKAKGREIVISTMVTPSGPIHLGNLKEVMIGYLVAEALKKAGAKVSFNFFADNFDSLRRVYPFLPKSYQKYVGVPLSEIPDPWKCHQRYDEHFITPFLEALKILRIKPRVRYIDKLYKEGVYAPAIEKALAKREQIAEIISKFSGRKIAKDWWPFMPRCEKCGKISTTKVISFNLDKKTVSYQCSCGRRGSANFSKGEGKLPWRVHWPAGWKIFGIQVEGFGKDLATKGGAYDTARVIVHKVLDGEAPFPVPYEWIYLKGAGKMASSTGLGFTPLEILKILPPEILIYFYKRSKPNTHQEFDIAESIVSLWSEHGGLSGIPFQHLAMAVQSSKDLKGVMESLVRTGYQKEVKEKRTKIKREVACIKNWLEKYAPPRFKIEVQKKLPPVNLTKKQKEFLSNILEAFVKEKMNGSELHQKIHQIRKQMEIEPKEAFSAIYLIFLGQDSGPQAGWFLANLNRNFVIKRIREAIEFIS